MSRLSLKAAVRTGTGKGANRKLRTAGLVPAVVYGKGKENATLTVAPKEVLAILKSDAGRYQPIELQVEGESAPRLALIKDFVVHPFKRTLRHVDFWEVAADEKIVVKVPLRRDGQAEIEKIGGRISFTHKLVRISCTPATMPHEIKYNVSHITEDAKVRPPRASEIPTPDGVKVIFKSDYSFFQLKLPKLVSDEDAAAEAEAATPAA